MQHVRCSMQVAPYEQSLKPTGEEEEPAREADSVLRSWLPRLLSARLVDPWLMDCCSGESMPEPPWDFQGRGGRPEAEESAPTDLPQEGPLGAVARDARAVPRTRSWGVPATCVNWNN